MKAEWDRDAIVNLLATATRGIDKFGYVRINSHRGFGREHILIAELALGRKMPPKAEVHHVNECKSDNSNGNLVICQDRTYHKLLHQRAKILNAGGDPENQKFCCTCKALLPFDSFHRLASNNSGRADRCVECASQNCKRVYAAKKRLALIEKERA